MPQSTFDIYINYLIFVSIHWWRIIGYIISLHINLFIYLFFIIYYTTSYIYYLLEKALGGGLIDSIVPPQMRHWITFIFYRRYLIKFYEVILSIK